MNPTTSSLFPPGSNSSGSVVVELALLAFILLFMGFGALYIDFGLSHSQLMSVVSREVANASFRQCARLPATDQTACLTEILTDSTPTPIDEGIYNNVSQRLPGLEITSSIYTCTPGGYSCTPAVCAPADTCVCTCTGGITRTGYSVAGISSGFPQTRYGDRDPSVTTYNNTTPVFIALQPVIDRHEVVAISEVFFTEPQSLVFGAQFQRFNLYETTIY